MSRRTTPSAARRVGQRVGAVVSFLGFYLVRFIRANLAVAREIVTPGDDLAPAVVEVPLRCRTRWEISSYISLITLSPGTMVLAAREGRTRLVVHGMHAADPDAFLAELLDLETRMLAAWRRGDAAPETPTDPPTRR